jgi:hypothetical protein
MSARLAGSCMPGSAFGEWPFLTHYSVWAGSALNLDLMIFEPERASCARAIRHSHPMQCINVRCFWSQVADEGISSGFPHSIKKSKFSGPFALTDKETVFSLSVGVASGAALESQSQCPPSDRSMNVKVVGSNPTPQPKFARNINMHKNINMMAATSGLFHSFTSCLCKGQRRSTQGRCRRSSLQSK